MRVTDGKPPLPKVVTTPQGWRSKPPLPRTRRFIVFSSAEEVLDFIKAEDVKFVDVRFCDLPGVMQHFNVPAKTVDIDFFTNG